MRRSAAPSSTRDLTPRESIALRAMRRLWYGRFEGWLIRQGECVIDPKPTTIRDLKFSLPQSIPAADTEEFALKHQFVEFFSCVRAIQEGMIRTLVVKDGLPFSIAIENASEQLWEASSE